MFVGADSTVIIEKQSQDTDARTSKFEQKPILEIATDRIEKSPKAHLQLSKRVSTLKKKSPRPASQINDESKEPKMNSAEHDVSPASNIEDGF